MGKKTDIRICRYTQCTHTNKEIDTTCDAFETIGKCYYHTDCYELKIKQDTAKKMSREKKEKKEPKGNKVRADMQLIKNLWIENISNTVVYSQLFRCLNDLLNQGVESDYLVFTMQYCVAHKLNLRYPFGFKYFVDKQEIKDAYRKKQLAQNRANQSNFSATDTDDAPKFSINTKPTGFSRILGGDK